MESSITITLAQLVVVVGSVGGVIGFMAGWLLTLLTSRNTATKLDDHLIECARRQLENGVALTEIRKGIEGLYKRGWWR